MFIEVTERKLVEEVFLCHPHTPPIFLFPIPFFEINKSVLEILLKGMAMKSLDFQFKPMALTTFYVENNAIVNIPLPNLIHIDMQNISERKSS